MRESTYTGYWENVQDDCMLCQMDERTQWYLETRNWLIAEKLGGGPFVIYKEHTDSLSDEEWNDMERVVGKLFDSFEVVVKMNLVEDHWHGHLVTDNAINLSGE